MASKQDAAVAQPANDAVPAEGDSKESTDAAAKRTQKTTSSKQVKPTPATAKLVQLGVNPVRFPPIVSRVSDPHIFFDEITRHIFVLTDGGRRVDVVYAGTNQSPDATPLRRVITFSKAEPIMSIRLSLDHRVLAVRKSKNSVHFYNVEADGNIGQSYSQTTKGRSSSVELQGFFWTYLNEILLVTNYGVELYQVQPAKRSLKLLKNFSVGATWCIYSKEAKTLVVSSTEDGHVLQAFMLPRGTMIRVPKLEIPTTPSFNRSSRIGQRDAVLAMLYGRPYLLLVRLSPQGAEGSKAEVWMYTVSKDGYERRYVLDLPFSGRVAINIIDNLILVHSQQAARTAIFDVKWNARRRNASLASSVKRATLHRPVVADAQILPVRLQLSGEQASPFCQTYASGWIAFQPNVIIDVKLGALWRININLEVFLEAMPDRAALVDLLLRRRGGRTLIVHIIMTTLLSDEPNRLAIVAQIFDLVNHVQEAVQKDTTLLDRYNYQLFTQQDLYNNVFLELREKHRVDSRFMVGVLMEFIRSLTAHRMNAEHFIFELVIQNLVESKRYYQLHQFLQYHVIDDSKPVACSLLALERTYPPALQLALDMFKRDGDSAPEIVEALLSCGQLLAALKFVQSEGTDMLSAIQPARFLAAADATNDHAVFYTVFTFLQRRNIKLRGVADFAKGEKCEKYEKKFFELFGNGAGEPRSSRA